MFFLLFLWMFVTDTLACVGTFSRRLPALKLQIDLSSYIIKDEATSS